MNKFLPLVIAAAATCLAGVANAEGGDADSQAGSAWRSNPEYAPVTGAAPYYGNSGWPPVDQIAAPSQNRYSYARPSRRGQHYPYNGYASRATRIDRDGDGVPNWRDRFPDDPTRQ